MKKIGELKTYTSDESQVTIPVKTKLDEINDDVAAEILSDASYMPNEHGNLDILVEDK